MNNMNKKYRCCISAEPDKGSFTKNMTFTEVETIQRKQVENEEWFKNQFILKLLYNLELFLFMAVFPFFLFYIN